MVIRIGFVGLLLVQFLGAIAYGALWLLLPPEPEDTTPGLEAASRNGLRTATKPKRRIDWGTLLALAALATGLLWLVQTSWLGTQPAPVLAGRVRLCRRGPGVAAGRHEPAAQVAGRGWRSGLVGAVRGPRRLAGGAAGDRRSRPGRGRLRHGGGPAEPDPGAARGDGHDRAGPRRAGGRAGAVALPLPHRPQRGAGREGPGRCPRRHGRPPARLGAADARPDPALGRRPQGGAAARPAPGAGAAVVAVRRAERRQDPQGGADHGRRRGGGRPGRTGRGGRRGGLRADRAAGGSGPGRAGGPGQRGQALGCRQDRRVRGSGRGPGRGVRPRSRSRLRSRRRGRRPARRASTASSTGWPGTADRRRSVLLRATEPKYDWRSTDDRTPWPAASPPRRQSGPAPGRDATTAAGHLRPPTDATPGRHTMPHRVAPPGTCRGGRE